MAIEIVSTTLQSGCEPLPIEHFGGLLLEAAKI
jgi:hypothetical protein